MPVTTPAPDDDPMAALLAEPARYDPASASEVDITDADSLALALRRARRHARLSQRALAARAGVSASAVARIETGTADPGIRTVVRLLTAAGVHLRVTGLEPTTFVFGIIERKRDAAGRHPPAHRLSEAGSGWWDTSPAAAIRHAISANLEDIRLLAGVAALRGRRR
jgi:transcriptional regulator with XRE-family HTH domain